MNFTKYWLIFAFCLVIVACGAKAQSVKKSSNKKPRLVLGIVVENMRPDYVSRFWNKFGEGGFKKLYTEGAVCSDVRLELHMHNYASGMATLYTGVDPSMHGIINEKWYSRLKKREMDCTGDDYYMTLGADSKNGDASPSQLLSNTINNVLKIYSLGKAKVFSVAVNRESAIFSAGHAADAAYWFDVDAGRMITSSFYLNTFPDWVRIFNSENYPARYAYRNWVTLLPEMQYTEAMRDDYVLERGYFGEYNTFPHAVSKYLKRTGDFRPFKTTPSANLMVKDFALQAIDNEGLGTDEVTDFLTVVFSSMDYENSSFGPSSLEMMDTYLYMDKYLSELLSAVEQKLGKENVLVFFTSDCSASYPVEILKDEYHVPVDYFNVEKAMALLTLFLNNTYGEGEWIEYYDEGQIYLDHELVEKEGIKLNEMREKVANFINQFEGVQVALPAHQLEQGASANGLMKPLYLSYFKNRSGDVLYSLKEGWQPAYKFKQVNYTDQSHIPLVFWGGEIGAKLITQRYQAVDMAPTLAALLGIPAPDKCQGEAIAPVLSK